MHTRTAHVHPNDIRNVLAAMIDLNIENFEVEDDRGGTGTWAVIVDGDKVPVGVFRKAVGRKSGISIERF